MTNTTRVTRTSHVDGRANMTDARSDAAPLDREAQAAERMRARASSAYQHVARVDDPPADDGERADASASAPTGDREADARARMDARRVNAHKTSIVEGQ